MTLWDVLKSDTMQTAHRVEEYRVRRMIKLGKLGPDDCVRPTGTDGWIRVADMDASKWKDELPTKDEQRDLHKSRKKSKDEPGAGRKKEPQRPPPPRLPSESEVLRDKPRPSPPPAKTPAPTPQGDAPVSPDANAATIHDASQDDPGIANAQEPRTFEVGPLIPADEPVSKRPRLVAPPIRRLPKEVDDESTFSIANPRPREELDLTSMVDVVFLLILFFMVTTTYALQRSLRMPPPPEEQAAQQAPTMDDLRDDNIIIEILEDNSIVLNDRPVPLIELVDLLRREVRDKGMNEVVVQAAGGAYHETVVAVFDAANEVGVQRIRLANPTVAEPTG